MLQADGKYELERNAFHAGDDCDLFRAGFRDSIGPSTSTGDFPNTDAYSSGNVFSTGNRIYDISESGEVMTFRYDIVSSGRAGSAPGKDSPATPVKRINRSFLQASASFPVSDSRTLFENSTLLSVELNLDETMDVHIRANTSATTSHEGQVLATGFSAQAEGRCQIWQDSFRLVTISKPDEHVNFGSTAVRRLPKGKHQIMWKILLRKGDVKLESGGSMSIQAFPPK